MTQESRRDAAGLAGATRDVEGFDGLGVELEITEMLLSSWRGWQATGGG